MPAISAVNDYHLPSGRGPFGGYNQSGIGREFGMEGVLEYTEIKHVHVDQVDNRPPSSGRRPVRRVTTT